MTKFISQTSWARGEIEPRLIGRQDADFYESAAARLSNFLPDAVAGISVRANFLSLGKIPRRLRRTAGALDVVLHGAFVYYDDEEPDGGCPPVTLVAPQQGEVRLEPVGGVGPYTIELAPDSPIQITWVYGGDFVESVTVDQVDGSWTLSVEVSDSCERIQSGANSYVLVRVTDDEGYHIDFPVPVSVYHAGGDPVDPLEVFVARAMANTGSVTPDPNCPPVTLEAPRLQDIWGEIQIFGGTPPYTVSLIEDNVSWEFGGGFVQNQGAAPNPSDDKQWRYTVDITDSCEHVSTEWGSHVVLRVTDSANASVDAEVPVSIVHRGISDDGPLAAYADGFMHSINTAPPSPNCPPELINAPRDSDEWVEIAIYGGEAPYTIEVLEDNVEWSTGGAYVSSQDAIVSPDDPNKWKYAVSLDNSCVSLRAKSGSHVLLRVTDSTGTDHVDVMVPVIISHGPLLPEDPPGNPGDPPIKPFEAEGPAPLQTTQDAFRVVVSPDRGHPHDKFDEVRSPEDVARRECERVDVGMDALMVEGEGMDPNFPYLHGPWTKHPEYDFYQQISGFDQEIYYNGQYIGIVHLRWYYWDNLDPGNRLQISLSVDMVSDCVPFTWSGNIELEFTERSEPATNDFSVDMDVPKGRSFVLNFPITIDWGVGDTPDPPDPPDPDPDPDPDPVEEGDLHLLPGYQNLLGYVYRGTQVLIHLGIYMDDDERYHIAVRPYQAEVKQLDTDSPMALDTKLVGGEVFLSAPFDVLTSRILYEVGFAVAGPAAFITHRLLPPLRVFPTDDPDAPFEVSPIGFYQELFGYATVETGTSTFKGDQDALFAEQLEVGDQVRFRNKLYTVASVGVQDEDDEADDYLHHWFTTEEQYDGVTLTDRVDLSDADPFDSEFPRLVAFYQGRLVLAATDARPTGVWMSRSGDPYVIVPSSVDDDSPINQELLAEGSDEFVWMTGGDRLYLGSGLGEYALGTSEETLTPTQLRFFRIGQNGGSKMTPEVVDGTVIFANRSRSQVLGVVYDLGRQAFNTSNLALLSGHLTEGVTDIAYRPPVQNDRTPRIFVLTRRGLRAFALSEAAGVAAWSRIEHSPSFSVQAIAGTSEYLFAICNRYNTQVDLAVLRNE